MPLPRLECHTPLNYKKIEDKKTQKVLYQEKMVLDFVEG